MIAAHNADSFKRLRKVAWLLAAICAFSSSSHAQGLTTAQFVKFSPSVSMAVRPAPAAIMPVATIVTAPVPLRNTILWWPPGSYHHDQHTSPIEKSVEISETPFGQQYRMTIGSLFGGRVLLGGFGNVTPMENILQGLPGSGTLLALSSTPMGRAGLKTPKVDQSYGLGLTLHRSGNAEGALSTKLIHCL